MKSRTPAPPSPAAQRQRHPSWLDLRLILGVLLVLVSVLVGARVISAADSSTRVWATTAPLAAGTVLQPADLRPVRVQLFDDAPAYLAVGASPAGRALRRDVGAGELLPRAALTAPAPGRLVSLPVDVLHAPDALSRGQRIDVFATGKEGAADQARTVRVLAAVPVQAVRRSAGGLTGSGSDLTVLVRVPAAAAQGVVAAVRGADLDVAVVTGDAPEASDAVALPDGAAG